MMKGGRALALALALNVTVCVGVSMAQTLIVTNAPAGSKVELALNSAAVGSAAADAGGEARIDVNLSANLGKNETDINVYVETCGDMRRVFLVEGGLQPPPVVGNCERRDVAGVFALRRVSTLVVNVGGANPTVLLRQGPFNPRTEGGKREWRRSPTGLVLFGSGALTKFRDVQLLSCGDLSQCSGGGFDPGYTAGAAYWILPFVAAEVGYMKPADAKVEGSGQNFRFNSVLDARFLTIAGNVGVPIGPVRLYGKVGGNFHQATFTTTQTNDDVTLTIDGVSQIVKGGTQTFELKTEGWGWLFGGGMEVWAKRWLALYGEAGFAGLKGHPVDDADGAMDDRMTYLLVGARVRIGR